MRTILEYLEQAEALYPQKTAVIDAAGEVTYEQLVSVSRGIGSGCIASGIPGGSPVPVLMEKGIPALSSFFGIVYAGCFYALLNPELPAARLQSILETLEARWILTDAEHAGLAEELSAGRKVILYEEIRNHPVQEALLEERRTGMIDLDPLYANFTSGSTGTPKGVLVGHRSVIDFIDIFTETFGIEPQDRIANQAPFDFDVSVKDIYSSLKMGATLVIVPKQLFSQPAALLDFLCEHQVTTLIWAVSALCLVTTFHGLDYKVPDMVRRVLFSGEVMPMKHLRQWMDHLPEAEFVNLYGPTEITCNCTYHCIDRQRDYGDTIPSGKPFPNERVFLLDGDDLVTEPGAVGEICVSGTALALGYYNNAEQTQTHFVQNPLNHAFFERIYRTGDLAMWNEAGELVFQGRKDFQIKYQGHRIELEEVEAAMMRVDGVERGCCVFDERRGRLYGYYVGTIEAGALEQALGRILPAFQIPKPLLPIESMPLTKNGKIDRKMLLEQATRRRRSR